MARLNRKLKWYVFTEDMAWALVGPFNDHEQAYKHPANPDSHREVISEVLVKHLSIKPITPEQDLALLRGAGII